MSDQIGFILIAIGVAFDFFGCLGLLRLPDVYNRLQAATKSVTVGTWAILIGVCVLSGFNSLGVKALLTVVMMDVTIQKVETAESTASADLQQVTTTIAVNYRIVPEAAGDIYKTLRQEFEFRVIKPNIEESIKAATAMFQAEELITKRELVKAKVKEILTERVREYNIEILAVYIIDFQFSTEFQRAIEAKVTAEQSALEAKNKLEQIRHEAQQQVIQAEAAANATIMTATAEAEAIRLVRESLTAEYLNYIAIQQWDGKLPLVVGEGTGLIIDVNSLLDEQQAPSG